MILFFRYSSGQLRVLAFAPSFAKNPVEELTYAAEKGNVTLQCKPEGAPQPEFNWRKDGNLISSGGKYIIFDNGNLFIRQVNLADEGVYKCEATNEYGKAEANGRLKVKLRHLKFIYSEKATKISKKITLDLTY